MAVLCRIYGSNTYSNIYATYDTDGDSEPGKYTSGLYLRNGAAGIEYDASNSETLNIIHGYAGGAASNMYFKFGAGTRMTLNDAGHLGIGTSSPNIVGFTGPMLTVNGTGNYQGLEIGTSGTTRMTVVSDGLNGYVSTRQAGMCLIFEAGAASEKMRITSGGNVGIGTSSPASKLHVLNSAVGGTYYGQLTVEESGEAAIQIKGTSYSSIYFSDAAAPYEAGIVYNHSTNNLELRGSGNSADLIITSAGRVGIGTSSPSTMLQVCGDVSGENAAWVQNTNSLGYGSLRALNNLNCAAVFGVGGSAVGAPYANTGYLYTDANVSFVFSIGTTEKMKITSTGNVGIACTSPGSKLTVGGTLTTTDTITTTSGTVSNYLTYTSTTGVIGTQTNHALQIRTNDTERIRVTCTGCIGVNITSPTYTLHVNGTFYAAGSSCEYKTQICNYNTDSCMFMKLKPVTYQYKDEYCHLGKELKSGTQIGLIAEDTAEVFPELAILKEEENKKVVRNVDYEKLTIILLSELQKLRQEVDQLKNK